MSWCRTRHHAEAESRLLRDGSCADHFQGEPQGLRGSSYQAEQHWHFHTQGVTENHDWKFQDDILVQNCSIWGVWGTCTAVCSPLDPWSAYWAQWHYPFMDSTRILRTLQPTKLFFVKQEMNLIHLITCLIHKSTFHFCPCQSHCPWHPWITFSTCVLWLYFSFKFHDLHLVLYMASDFTPHYSPSVGLRQRKLLKNTTKGKKTTTAERIMS